LPDYDLTGLISYQRNGLDHPQPRYIPAVGTILLSGGNRVLQITQGQPTSCLFSMDDMLGWKRDGWDCTVQYGAQMTSTTDEFHLREWLVAKKGDQEIFRRETPSVIKRDLL
jgi:hypothetical protein